MASLHPGLSRAAFLLFTLLAACAGREPGEQSQAEAQGLLEAASESYKQGHLDTAIRTCTNALEVMPDFGEAYLLRGKAKLKRIDLSGGERYLEETESAILDFAEAVKHLPWMFEPYFHRAIAYASIARYKEAAYDLMHHCIKIRPDDRQANLMLAKVYDAGFEGREPEAMKYYEKYLMLGGTDPKVRTRYEELKLFVKAVQIVDDDEKKAADLFAAALKANTEGRRDEASKMLIELTQKYAKTSFVKDREKIIAQLIQQLSPDKK